MVSLSLIDIIGWKMKKSRSMIFGEYLRNVCYGRKGGIEPPENEVEGLEEYVSYYYNLA